MMPHTVPHSVMFHHFHDDKHIPIQGSLNETNFREMLIWLKENYSLLGAKNYKDKFESGTLANEDICLSFDDALQCQYDIAIPVMEDFKIDAFFFIYSSAFTNSPDYLEVYRYFRNSAFDDVNHFYFKFFDSVKQLDKNLFAKQQAHFNSIDYLQECPFYSDNDKWFRYLRDQHLGPQNYDEVMKSLMLVSGFDIQNAKRNLWMSDVELSGICQKGHSIGLHSYSHPTQMSKLPRAKQEIEYQKNYDHLFKITNSPIEVMSHPCGDYNQDTLDVLNSMGVSMGFCSTMTLLGPRSPLEIPREDQVNVFREMHK